SARPGRRIVMSYTPAADRLRKWLDETTPSDHHVGHLAESGITKDEALAAGIRTVTDPERVQRLLRWDGPADGPPRPREGPADELSVNELIVKFWAHARRYYVKSGKASSELRHFGYAIKPLRLLYGLTPVGQFTPIALK